MIENLFGRIRAAHDDNWSELETERLTRDLTRVAERTEQRQYEKASFDSNLLDMPGRLNQLLVEIDFYASVGRAWATVLSETSLPPKIADLCPGYAPKLQIAAFYGGYDGEIVLIDKAEEALEDVERFTALFRPSFEMTRLIADVFRDDVGQYALVTGSHIVDDLVIDTYCDDPPALYKTEGALVDLWHSVLSDRQPKLHVMIDRLSSMIRKVVAPGGRVVLLQYPSYTERSLGLDGAHDFCADVLDGTIRALQPEFGRFVPPAPSVGMFTVDRWWVLDRTSS